jgi:DNA-binding beta-propeller fold protein YncE
MLPACDRKPNDPDDPIKPKEYVFWMPEYYNRIEGVNRYYRYFPVQDKFDTVISAIQCDYYYGATASADGSKLYLPNSDISVVTSDSMRLLTTIANAGHTSVSADGRFLGICSGQGVRILNATTHLPWFEDTLQTMFGSFSQNGTRFFALSADSRLNWIAEYDVLNRSLVRLIDLPHGNPHRVYPVENGDRLLLSLQYNSFDFAFAIYDQALDTFVLWHYLSPGHPRIAVAPNEKYALVTNPGTLLIGPPKPSSFLVFDLELNQLREEVDTRVVNPDSIKHAGRLPTKHVTITPDSKYALVTGIDDGEFLIYNLQTMKIETYHDYSYTNGIITTWFSNVTCQAEI